MSTDSAILSDSRPIPDSLPLANAGSGEALGRKAIAGGIALTAARIFAKLLGTLRQLLLPRWLGPEQMGIFGVAVLAISAMDALSQTGLTSALMQKQGDHEKYLSPVRTVQAIRGMVMCFAVLVSAPLLAGFFDSPGAIGVIRAVALLPLIQGFEPLFATLTSKNLQFFRLVKLQLISGVVGLLAAVGVAYFHPTAWALVAGVLASALATTVGAHVLSKAGRGFSLHWGVLRDLHTFGFWVFVTLVLSYVFIRGGDWIIGRYLDVKTLALYQIAYWFSTLLTAETGAIINQVAFPTFAKVQNDLPRLRSAFNQMVGALTMVSGGVGIVSCLWADWYFTHVLGSQWAPNKALFLQLIPWLVVWGACGVLSASLCALIQARGHPRWWASIVFGMCVMMGISVVPMAHAFGALGVGILLAAIGILAVLVGLAFATHLVHGRFREVFANLVLPSTLAVVSVLSARSASMLFIRRPWQTIAGTIIAMGVYTGGLILLSRFLQPNPRRVLAHMASALASRILAKPKGARL